jgi:hypothetical protein
MSKFLLTGLAALAGVAFLSGPATATLIMPSAPPPLYSRLAAAEYVVLGKVTGHGDPVSLGFDNFNPQLKVKYNVAKFKISKVLSGPKTIKEARVLFQAPGRFGAFPQQQSLPVRTEGVLFLKKRTGTDYYDLGAYPAVLAKKNNPKFKKELAYIQRCVKLLKDPEAGLKSRSKSDRLLTAALLISRYRSYRGAHKNLRTESVGADRSKLILAQLAAANWLPKAKSMEPKPIELFDQLGLTAKDGWNYPLVFGVPSPAQKRKRALAARAWVMKNYKTYRIQQFVDKDAKKDSSGKK